MQLVFLVAFLGFLIGCGEKSSQFKGPESVSCEEQTLKSQFIVHWHNREPTLVRFEDSENVDDFIREHSNELSFVEPNYAIRIQPPPSTENTEVNFALGVSDILKSIGVYPAWDNGYTGQNILVAVIDSGVDINNVNLRRNIYTNPGEIPNNGIDDDRNGFVDDVHGWNFTNDTNQVYDEIGHGTSVAGIIAGSRDSSETLAIAPDSRILPVDIISGYTGSEFDAKRGVDYALQMKARVINNSWSIACSRYLARSFQSYERRDVLFVNSAGNVRQDVLHSRLMLASLTLSNFLNVGSTTLFGDLSSFSGYGSSINIWAPGEQIPVLSHSSSSGTSSEASGTSISAAVVSGAAAVVWSAHPGYSSEKLITKLVKGSYKRNGHSIISIDRALGLWTEPVFPIDPLEGAAPAPTQPDTNSPTTPLPEPVIHPGESAENPGETENSSVRNPSPPNSSEESPRPPEDWSFEAYR